MNLDLQEWLSEHWMNAEECVIEWVTEYIKWMNKSVSEWTDNWGGILSWLVRERMSVWEKVWVEKVERCAKWHKLL